MQKTIVSFFKYVSFFLIAFLVVLYGQFTYGFTVKQPNTSFSDLTKEHTLVMGNAAAQKKAVVFTDPDCPYCLKLHTELKKIVAQRNDVAFYIKLFPLVMHKDAYWKSKSILCSSSLQMLEDNFEKKPIPAQDCNSDAVDKTIELAKSLGINGVPTVIFPDGRRQTGYVPSDAIMAYFDGQPSVMAQAPKTVPAPDQTDISLPPNAQARYNSKAYAIVIGIETYRQKLPKADFAVADAKTVTEYLTKIMGYPEENVVTLTNDLAALGDFVKYFEKWLPNNVEKGGTVFVYYSGHGAPNPKTGDAYLVPYDGDPAFIGETGYPLRRLYESLGKLPAKEIIVALDSCFSGAGGRSVIAKGARPLVMTMSSDSIPTKVAVLSAASGDQISSTYEEKGHGLFTYFMLKGIKNEGVVKPDGSIALSELFSYVKPQVERIARKQYNNEQTPQLIGAKKN
jgi:thioredoxin-related protein